MYNIDTYSEITWVFAVADPKIPLSLNTVLAATKAYVSSKIKKGKKDEIGGRGGKLEMLEFEFAKKGFQDVFYITRMHLGLPPSSLVLPPPTPATMQLLRQGGFAIGPTSAIPQGASRSGGDHVRLSPRVCSSATTSSLSANPATTDSPSLSVDIPSPVIDISTGLLPNGGRVYEMPAPRHADVIRVVRTNDLPLVTPLPVPSVRQPRNPPSSNLGAGSSRAARRLSQPSNQPPRTGLPDSAQVTALSTALNASTSRQRPTSAGSAAPNRPRLIWTADHPILRGQTEDDSDPYARLPPPVYGADTSLPSASQVARFERRQSEMMQSLMSYQLLREEIGRIATPPPEYSRA